MRHFIGIKNIGENDKNKLAKNLKICKNNNQIELLHEVQQSNNVKWSIKKIKLSFFIPRYRAVKWRPIHLVPYFHIYSKTTHNILIHLLDRAIIINKEITASNCCYVTSLSSYCCYRNIHCLDVNNNFCRVLFLTGNLSPARYRRGDQPPCKNRVRKQ